jgi:uncharacterized protein
MARLLLAFLAVLALALPVQAQSLPDPISPYLNDLAGVIDADTAAQITVELRAADIDPGVEIAVVTLRSRQDHAPGSTLEGFGKALFNHWGVGDAARNDGILIVVLTEDREVRIALGAAYPPVYDGRAQRVIDALILPEFQQGNLGAGILAGAIGARDHIARPLREGAQVTTDSGLPAVPKSGFPWDVAAFVAFVAGLIGFKARNGIADAIARRRPCPRCGAMGVEILRRTTLEPGETTEGQHVTLRYCPHCDWESPRYRAIPSLNSQRDQGGRSGFGGGSSSGGGASGRW